MAMEGPTPVSALIHAATMVTAGVYLLMRVSPLIEYSSTVLILCLWVGAITTVFSSLIGLFQQDIKKVKIKFTIFQENNCTLNQLFVYYMGLLYLIRIPFPTIFKFYFKNSKIRSTPKPSYHNIGATYLHYDSSKNRTWITSLSKTHFTY
jgi:NADH-ubiquinone oxidoreductase chain 5